MTFLFLIRHGETPWTKDRRFQGSTNTRLTSRGRQQAAAVARCLKRYGVDVLYTSDLQRARETANAISKVISKKARPDKHLRELGFGEWEGRTSADLLKDKASGYQKWCRGRRISPKGGETITALQKRIKNFLRRMTQKHRNKKIAVVTHGGPVKIFLYEALKMPFRSLWSFRVETASITVIGFGKHFSQVYCVNDTSHLPQHLISTPEYIGT